MKIQRLFDMCKRQGIKISMLNFVLNAPAGTRFCYGESEAKPSWLVEELVDLYLILIRGTEMSQNS